MCLSNDVHVNLISEMHLLWMADLSRFLFRTMQGAGGCRIMCRCRRRVGPVRVPHRRIIFVLKGDMMHERGCYLCKPPVVVFCILGRLCATVQRVKACASDSLQCCDDIFRKILQIRNLTGNLWVEKVENFCVRKFECSLRLIFSKSSSIKPLLLGYFNF